MFNSGADCVVDGKGFSAAELPAPWPFLEETRHEWFSITRERLNSDKNRLRLGRSESEISSVPVKEKLVVYSNQIISLYLGIGTKQWRMKARPKIFDPFYNFKSSFACGFLNLEKNSQS